jgi:hypothetical protein
MAGIDVGAKVDLRGGAAEEWREFTSALALARRRRTMGTTRAAEVTASYNNDKIR